MVEAKVISRDVVALAQHVELNGSGWFEAAVKKAIRFLLWMIDEPASIDAIYNEREAVGLRSVTKKELQSSIDAMIESGMILPTNDGRVKLTEQEATALRNAIETAQNVEQKVKTKVLEAATGAGAAFKEDAAVKMWDSFHKEFVAPFVSEFGARAYELVTGVTTEAKKTQFITEFLGRFGENEKSVLEPMILALLEPD